MNKEKVKKFWNEHKSTIKKAVILVTVPVAVIGVYVLVNKILENNNKVILKQLEDNVNEDEA